MPFHIHTQTHVLRKGNSQAKHPGLLVTSLKISQKFKCIVALLQKYRYHIIGWLAFITYEVSAVGIVSGSFGTVGDYTVHYILNIVYFYLHAHFFLPLALRRRHLVLLALPGTLVFEYFLYVSAVYSVEFLGINYFGLELSRPLELDLTYAIRSLWRCLYLLGLSTAYYLLITLRREQGRREELEKQKLRDIIERQRVEKELTESQNAYLRAQINPHLLFNTLSFVYSNVQDVSPKASEGIMLLSEVMHYALGPVHEDGKTDLYREVEQVKKYIALNQLRFSKPLQLQTVFEGGFSQHRLPPLLLLTFIENMFKHGILNDPAHPATVSIKCTDSTLHLSTRNKKRSSFLQKGFGIGIQNVESRLRKFFREEDFSLHIQEDELYYETNLRIALS
ncbi:sensor histidine kinase [Pontibacter diazotrophicus]|uniref:sensor histidine kinase n=1 Tax=Pontibacter diazotrophicus TaxID=1400979 RepID=UPI0015F17C9B|nr:histidine kinase [Pontibacter diazotrophicus]